MGSNMESWTQVSRHHWRLVAQGREVDVTYRPAGFGSGWEVSVDGSAIGRAPDLMNARFMAGQAAERRAA